MVRTGQPGTLNMPALGTQRTTYRVLRRHREHDGELVASRRVLSKFSGATTATAATNAVVVVVGGRETLLMTDGDRESAVTGMDVKVEGQGTAMRCDHTILCFYAICIIIIISKLNAHVNYPQNAVDGDTVHSADVMPNMPRATLTPNHHHRDHPTRQLPRCPAQRCALSERT